MSHRAFEAGIEYQMDGRVHDLRTTSDGTTIQARVKGSGRATCEQTILLVRGPKGRLVPSGSCSCPVGFNCKHGAAVLFEYQEQAALAPGMGGPQPQQKELPRAGQPAHQSDSAANVAASDAVEAPLPYDVDAWSRTLDAAQQEESEDYPPTVRKRLLCVLARSRAAFRGRDRQHPLGRAQARRDDGEDVHPPSSRPVAPCWPATKVPPTIGSRYFKATAGRGCRSQRRHSLQRCRPSSPPAEAAGEAGMAQPWPKDPRHRATSAGGSSRMAVSGPSWVSLRR